MDLHDNIYSNGGADRKRKRQVIEPVVPAAIPTTTTAAAPFALSSSSIGNNNDLNDMTNMNIDNGFQPSGSPLAGSEPGSEPDAAGPFPTQQVSGDFSNDNNNNFNNFNNMNSNIDYNNGRFEGPIDSGNDLNDGNRGGYGGGYGGRRFGGNNGFEGNNRGGFRPEFEGNREGGRRGGNGRFRPDFNEGGSRPGFSSQGRRPGYQSGGRFRPGGFRNGNGFRGERPGEPNFRPNFPEEPEPVVPTVPFSTFITQTVAPSLPQPTPLSSSSFFLTNTTVSNGFPTLSVGINGSAGPYANSTVVATTGLPSSTSLSYGASAMTSLGSGSASTNGSPFVLSSGVGSAASSFFGGGSSTGLTGSQSTNPAGLTVTGTSQNPPNPLSSSAFIVPTGGNPPSASSFGSASSSSLSDSIFSSITNTAATGSSMVSTNPFIGGGAPTTATSASPFGSAPTSGSSTSNFFGSSAPTSTSSSSSTSAVSPIAASSSTAAAPPTQTSINTVSNAKTGVNGGVVAGGFIGGVAGVAGIAGIVLYCLKRRKQQKDTPSIEAPADGTGAPVGSGFGSFRSNISQFTSRLPFGDSVNPTAAPDQQQLNGRDPSPAASSQYSQGGSFRGRALERTRNAGAAVAGALAISRSRSRLNGPSTARGRKESRLSIGADQPVPDYGGRGPSAFARKMSNAFRGGNSNNNPRAANGAQRVSIGQFPSSTDVMAERYQVGAFQNPNPFSEIEGENPRQSILRVMNPSSSIDSTPGETPRLMAGGFDAPQSPSAIAAPIVRKPVAAANPFAQNSIGPAPPREAVPPISPIIEEPPRVVSRYEPLAWRTRGPGESPLSPELAQPRPRHPPSTYSVTSRYSGVKSTIYNPSVYYNQSTAPDASAAPPLPAMPQIYGPAGNPFSDPISPVSEGYEPSSHAGSLRAPSRLSDDSDTLAREYGRDSRINPYGLTPVNAYGRPGLGDRARTRSDQFDLDHPDIWQAMNGVDGTGAGPRARSG